jgi:hypothetical protein
MQRAVMSCPSDNSEFTSVNAPAMREPLDRPQRLRTPFTGLLRACIWGTPACAVAAAALLAYGIPQFGVPDAAGAAAAFVIGALLSGVTLAGVITLPLLVRERRRCDREFAEIERGEFLLHWTYHPDEWQSFIRAELAEARRYPWVMTIILGIIGLIAGAGSADEKWAAGSSWAVFLGVFAGGAICGTGVDWLIRRSALRACRRLEQGTPEAWFGRHGVYFNGVYRRYSDRSQCLHAIELLPDRTPQTLVLTFRCRHPKGDFYEFLRLPVPAGQEQLAQQLASHPVLLWRG